MLNVHNPNTGKRFEVLTLPQSGAERRHFVLRYGSAFINMHFVRLRNLILRMLKLENVERICETSQFPELRSLLVRNLGFHCKNGESGAKLD